jgi:ABC-type branched-subunit amino acid transport system substrate-binding protein
MPIVCRSALRLIASVMPLLAAACVALAAPSRSAEHRVALVIGNAAYQAGPPLANPVNDAHAMAAKLTTLGFEVISVENGTQKLMQRALLQFSSKLGPDTVSLFYYAGHGIQVGGHNYLVPIDAEIGAEQTVRVETIDVDAVIDQMAAANSRVSLVILDACRNNPFERRFRGQSGGLASIDAPTGTLIAYATSPGKVAADGDRGNGLYTAELLRAMDTPGAKVEDVFKRVRVNVTERSRGAQTPWESTSLTGDFYFAGSTTAMVGAPAGGAAASPEMLLWSSVKDSRNPALLQSYLDQFPQGVFAGAARIMIEDLRQPQIAAAPTKPDLAPPAPPPPSRGEAIHIGQTQPYSGPASAYSAIGKVEVAYFAMLNEQGGINGRKIDLVSLDDGYAPPKTVEQTRRLVEQDNVLLLFNTLGTPPNSAIHKYMNAKGVPHLLVASGASKWGDPEHFPWTMGFQPSYRTEARIYAKYLLQTKPDAKIAVLYQNDDYGKDYLQGLRSGLGDKASRMIVAEASYEVTDPTIDSQIVSLKGTGADVLFSVATPKFAAQAVRKVYDIGWRPLHILNSVSISTRAVLEPAGLDKATGLISAGYYKDPADPRYAQDPAMQEWLSFMKRYVPDGSTTDGFNLYGYLAAQTMAQVLKQCGNDLSRENVMRQATNLNFSPPLLLPGVSITTGPRDFFPIKQMMLQRFDGTRWVPFSEAISG